MRTTLDIDDEILRAAKDLGRRQRKTAGQVLSELARKALTTIEPLAESDSFLGFTPFPARGEWVDNDTIDRIREEVGA